MVLKGTANPVSRSDPWDNGPPLIYMIFIAFNGFVVFKTGSIRVVGLVASLFLFAAFLDKPAKLRQFNE